MQQNLKQKKETWKIEISKEHFQKENKPYFFYQSIKQKQNKANLRESTFTSSVNSVIVLLMKWNQNKIEKYMKKKLQTANLARFCNKQSSCTHREEEENTNISTRVVHHLNLSIFTTFNLILTTTTDYYHHF